jgi:hypothetical protein
MCSPLLSISLHMTATLAPKGFAKSFALACCWPLHFISSECKHDQSRLILHKLEGSNQILESYISLICFMSRFQLVL